jgi:hypothetical protein
MSKTKNKNKVVAYGYVARWSDGTLGWNVSQYLSYRSKLNRPTQPNYNENTKGTKFELCKITIETVKGKRKRRPKP